MDFPVFHLDFLGNRMLIALIAVVHVFINHSLAVGAMPLVTAMEFWGYRRGDHRWDLLAYRILTVCFVITTTLGALTGVGIWLSTSLVNPYAIGSLIRVFFWAWFAEWLVFVAEVVFIMIYYLTWKKMQEQQVGPHRHRSRAQPLLLGDDGDHHRHPRLHDEPRELDRAGDVLSPVSSTPSTCRSSPSALRWRWWRRVGWLSFLAFFFTRRDRELRTQAVRVISMWSLAWLPLAAAGALWYWRVIPEWMEIERAHCSRDPTIRRLV